jgi:pyruvate, water dikinase
MITRMTGVLGHSSCATAEAKMARRYIRWFEDIGADDVASVGGKNASLGEMVRNLRCYDIKVPTGFATTAEGYRHFLVANNLGPVIASSLAGWG